jgi:DNA-binding NarL/FixJ family response regulator
MTLPPPRPTSSFSGRLAEGWTLVRTGRIRRAASELGAPRRDLTAAEHVEHASLVLTCRLAVGDLTAASTTGALLEPALAGDGPSGALAHLGHGELAAALGDHERALGHFRRAGEAGSDDDPALVPWRAGAALALVHLRTRGEATAIARELLASAHRAADPWLAATALRTVAIVDATADAPATLDRAGRLARSSGDVRLAAQIDTDLAGLLLLLPSADSERAVGLLRSAEEYAAKEALWPLHSRVSRLLDRAGERVRPLRGDAVTLLTQAEQRVARLAARGLTNRQIAEQLSVTVKGVEWHLSRVYRKLGIRSRSGLADLVEVGGTYSATA